MADQNYKGFFERNNPLNIYNQLISEKKETANLGVGSNTTDIQRELSFRNYMNYQGQVNPKPTSDPKYQWESDEDYNERLQREEDWYQEYVRRQLEYNDQLKQEEEKAFQKNLISPNYENTPEFYQKAQDEAKRNVALGIDEETGEFKRPELAWSRLSDELSNYNSMYDDVNTLSKAFYDTDIQDEDPDNQYILALKDLVKEDQIKRGNVKDAEEFDNEWSTVGQEGRLKLITAAVGRKYFKGDTLDEFAEGGYWERLNMLASYIRNSPYYRTMASEHKKDIDWGDNEFSKNWDAATEHATNRFLHGITGGNGWDPIGAFSDIVGGGVLSLVGMAGQLAGSVLGSAGEYVQSRIEGMGFEEGVDAFLRERAEEYIDNKAELKYEELLTKTPAEKAALLDTFRELSKQASSEYNIEQGTSLTKLPNGDADELREFAKDITIAQMYGVDAANKHIQEFWDDTISGNQSLGDKVLRTGANFFNNGVADIAAFAGVILNPIYMPIDYNGSMDPDDWTVDGEGYMDALVKRNPLVKWATDLQETGAWDTDLQQKYKATGVNAQQIYKSTAEKNSFLSWDDAFDIVGQYGFSAASTAISLGGSGAVKGLASKTANLARNSKGVAGKISRGIAGRDAREALKKGLAAGATEEEISLANATAARLTANRLYKGNLGVGAMVGTAEGALEAKSTYNTFLEDNQRAWREEFSKRAAAINDDKVVREYMLSNGYNPDMFVKTAEGQTYGDFSPEQYEKARQEMTQKLDEVNQAMLERMEDNAADAAAANFISNSFINGVANVLMKESLLSRDVREASRILKNRNKYNDLIDVVKKGNKWEAIVKKAVDENGKRGLWRTLKDVGGKTFKNAGGEFIEEYTQNISDQASRDALQYDLDKYMETVFDKEAREAFQSDWSGILGSGLQSIKSSVFNVDNIKAGVFGALSSMAGGLSPAGMGAAAKGLFSKRADDEKGVWGTAKWLAKNLSNIYQGSIQQAIRDSNEEYQTAQKLTENINAWLNTSQNQELLNHMGGAEGFKRALENAIIAGDEFTAHDSKLGLAVENAFMLQALKNTKYGQAMQQKFQENLELLEIAQDDANFDQNGNYIGNANANANAEGTTDNAQEDWVRTAISTFKNRLGDATRNTRLTDRQIVERIGKNAQEFLEIQNEVARAQQEIQKIFGASNEDPLVEQAFVYALLSQKNTRERRDSLREKLTKALSQDNLNEDDKQELKESGLNQQTIDFLVKYGSLEAAERKHKKITEEINQLNEARHDKKTSSKDKKEDRAREKYLTKEANQLQREIALEKDRREQGKLQATQEGENKKITLVEDEVKTLFSVGDIANMSIQQRAEVIKNKARYSKEQQAVIDKFLSIARTNLASESQDIALSNEEVAKDFMDLAVLETRANSYDRYLTEYINDPRFLTTTANNYRQKERTRTLRHLYKEDLKTRKGESILALKERLDSKVKELNALGKHEDAAIFSRLMAENKDIAKLNSNINEALLATAIYTGLNEGVSQDKEFDLTNATLLTLIANSGLSIKEIKDLLDKADTTEITKILQRTTADGQNALNRTLGQRGLQPFDLNGDVLHDEMVLANTIQKVKEFVDFYTQVKNESGTNAQRTAPKVVSNSNTTASPTAPATPPATPPRPQNRTQSNESKELRVITPGNLGNNPAVAKFFEEKQVSRNVQEFDPISGASVQFAAIKGADGKTVFAVQPSQTQDSGTVMIGGKPYRVIGAMDPQESDTLTSLGQKAYETLAGAGDDGILLNGDDGEALSVEFNKKGAPQAKSDINQESEVPLRDQFHDSTEEDLWVASLIETGEKVPSNTEGKQYLRDKHGYSVHVREGVSSIMDFPVVDQKGNWTTLGEVLNMPEEDALEILMGDKNGFFNVFFEAWGGSPDGFSPVVDYSPEAIYNWLLGDFIYMGYPNGDPNDPGAKQNQLCPHIVLDSERRKILKIIGKDKENPQVISFRLPAPQDSERQRAHLALEALKTIKEACAYDIKDIDERAEKNKLFHTNPQLGMNIISNRAVSQKRRDKEARRLKGMISAGVLTGVVPSFIDRQLTMLNPFLSRAASPRSNDPNASQFDPAPKGGAPGGQVHVADGTTAGGAPQTGEKAIYNRLNEKQKAAQRIVDQIIQESTTITQESSNAETYEGTGSSGNTSFSRATSVKQAFHGADTSPFDAEEEVATLSHALGNTVDPVMRAALSALNKLLDTGTVYSTQDASGKGPEWLYNEILKDAKFAGKTELPNWSKTQWKSFLTQVIAFHQACTAKGWVLVPNDIKAFGTAPVLGDDGAQVGTMPVAGTLDILMYDSEGVFGVIDIKTKHVTDKGTVMQDSDKEEWTAQTTTYQALEQQKHKGMQFGKNYIFPVFLPYSMALTDVELEDDGMTVKNFMPMEAPSLMPFANSRFGRLQGKQPESMSPTDFLYELEEREFLGYDYSRLSESDKKRVQPTSVEGGPILPGPNAQGSGAPTETPPPAPPVVGGTSSLKISHSDAIDQYAGLFDDEEMESRRSKKQAKQIEFINNHVAPVSHAKIGIVSKAVSKIKSLLGKDGKNIILQKELSNMFFNGDSKKLELVLRGQKITEENLPEIITKLRNYYTSYVQNSERYTASITRRYQISKATCDFLKGDITQAQLEEELDKYSVSPSDVSELFEYMSAVDKQEAAARILNKIETSKVNTIERYQQDLAAMKATIEDMETKLEFLNNNSAASMIANRVNSVQAAINSGSYQETPYKSTAALEDLLKTKSGSYGATKLLRGIALRTKNGHFKRLANILLRQIKEKGITVPITVADGGLNFVEGSTKGRTITIQKSSIDTYEHLERVLLHEMIHAVIEFSPEMKAMVQSFIDQAIESIQKTTGQSIEQIKEDYYGLSNADEFISEFFTNFAFQETLKTIGSNNYNNIFDRVIGGIREKLTGEKSLYDQISETMENILGSVNVEKIEIQNRKEPYTGKMKFSDLSDAQQGRLLQMGMTVKEFEEMTTIEQEHLKACCS